MTSAGPNAVGPMALSLERLDDARQALREERRRVVDEREAFRAFRDDLATRAATTATATPMATKSLDDRQPIDNSLSRVRRSYERTVMSVPHYDEEYGDTFEESVTVEFGPDVAAAFCSASVFSPPLRQRVATGAAAAVHERSEFLEVLDAEAESVESMRDGLSDLDARLVALDETPLTERGFGECLALYDDLTALADRLDALAAERQQTITAHRRALSSLVPDVTEFLYEALPVRYPVLATLADARDVLDTAARRVERRLASTP